MKMKKSERKDRTVHVAVSQDEIEEIKKIAHFYGLTMSKMLRGLLLNVASLYKEDPIRVLGMIRGRENN